jgi:DNA-binding response OmpR family regulator
MPATSAKEGAACVASIIRNATSILVVDDDPTMLLVIALILTRSGYKVLTAQKGDEALNAFKESEHTIQLVISDVVMPGMMGPELIQLIKNLSPSTGALLMTCAKILSSNNGVALILKPFTQEALVEKVHGILADCDFAKIEREQSNTRAQRLEAMPTRCPRCQIT